MYTGCFLINFNKRGVFELTVTFATKSTSTNILKSLHFFNVWRYIFTLFWHCLSSFNASRHVISVVWNSTSNAVFLKKQTETDEKISTIDPRSWPKEQSYKACLDNYEPPCIMRSSEEITVNTSSAFTQALENLISQVNQFIRKLTFFL